MTLTKISPFRFCRLSLLVFFLNSLPMADASSPPIYIEEPSIRSLIKNGQTSAAMVALEEKLKTTEKGAKRSLIEFGIGVLAHDKGQNALARKHLQTSLESENLLEDLALYYLGQVELQLGLRSEAKKRFHQALKKSPTRDLKYEIKYALGLAEYEDKRWSSARRQFRYLERRVRRDQKHPHVLWYLMQTELKLNRKWRACRWARKIYSRYPAHDLIDSWTINLQEAQVEGKTLGCVPTTSDQKSRVRRLQWSGHAQKALVELKTLQSRATEKTKYFVDSLLARFYVFDGRVQDALDLLLSHYDSKKRDYSYLMLLAKAASRSGEYQTAVGAYYRAHSLHSRGRRGRRALFLAAFLSYQFQDYDGAARKFEEFRRTYRRSGLSKDAEWHLAWIKYLKRDYQGAEERLAKILKKQRRRRWRSMAPEKVRYWHAMSLLRLDKKDEALQELQTLAKDKTLGYYSILARLRLERDFPKQMRDIASETDNLSSVPPTPEKSEKWTENPDKVSEENESEESLAESERRGNQVDEITPPDTLPEDMFKSPRLVRHFTRARALVSVGQFRWARQEYYEIERHTRNKTYLRALMENYNNLEFFYRSSYIGQIHFAKDRERYGVDGIQFLWRHTYPKAYEGQVTAFSQSFQVPQELIWAIMKAESHYRPEVRSPVGAIGLMQIMPYTGRHLARLLGQENFQTQNLLRPEYNIRLGTRYLHRLMKKFGRRFPLVAAGYNAGPHRVDNWLNQFGRLEMDEFIEHIPFLETRNYVKKVVRNYMIYQHLYSQQAPRLTLLVEPVGLIASSSISTRENWGRLEKREVAPPAKE